MGRSITPTFRLEIKTVGAGWTSLTWRGKATEKKLEDYVFGYARSIETGGTNAHLSESLGYIPYPTEARLIRQATSEVVATWKAATFQVFSEIKNV